MSERKDDQKEELTDEQLSKVSGGAGVANPTDLMEIEGITSPDDAARRRRKYNDIAVTTNIDKSTP